MIRVRKKDRNTEAGYYPDDEDQQLATELAEKVSWLFDNFRKENNQRFTLKEVEAATNGRITYQWLWRLANAHVASPGIQPIKILTAFFGVNPKIWFVELTEELKLSLITEHVQRLNGVRADQLQQFALRLSLLSMEDLELIERLIERLSRK